MKIFITGMPACGKTTLIKQLMKKIKEYVALISEEIRTKGIRKGFSLSLILDGKKVETNYLALTEKIENKKAIKFRKYFVFIDNIDEIIAGLEKIWQSREIIFIDEIGKMEFFSEKFKKFINTLLKSNRIVIATLHRVYVKKFEKYGKIYWLTKENFDEVFKEIYKAIS